MQTFKAQYVRPNGERGVIYVLAASAVLAMLDVMQQTGPLASVNVVPKRRAALLVHTPQAPKDDGLDGEELA